MWNSPGTELRNEWWWLEWGKLVRETELLSLSADDIHAEAHHGPIFRATSWVLRAWRTGRKGRQMTRRGLAVPARFATLQMWKRGNVIFGESLDGAGSLADTSTFPISRNVKLGYLCAPFMWGGDYNPAIAEKQCITRPEIATGAGLSMWNWDVLSSKTIYVDVWMIFWLTHWMKWSLKAFGQLKT